MPARQFVAMAVNALAKESDVTILQVVNGKAMEALNNFADPAWAPAGWQMLADGAYKSLLAADPVSGQQLAFARAYIATSTTPADFERLSDWLAGRDVPDGLPVGQDLRWQILGVLAAFGQVDTDEIDAELARDHNTVSENRAAGAKASRPTAEAKAEAFAELTTADDLPVLRQRSLNASLYHWTQIELTEPQRDGYFDTLDAVWELRPGGQAFEYAISGYPYVHVSEATVAKAEQWLAARATTRWLASTSPTAWT